MCVSFLRGPHRMLYTFHSHLPHRSRTTRGALNIHSGVWGLLLRWHTHDRHFNATALRQSPIDVTITTAIIFAWIPLSVVYMHTYIEVIGWFGGGMRRQSHIGHVACIHIVPVIIVITATQTKPYNEPNTKTSHFLPNTARCLSPFDWTLRTVNLLE